MSNPRVSIIILNWNGLQMLKTCLPSVVATEYPDLEIIVADNASTDGSVAWVEAQYPQVKTVLHAENGGYSRGNNLAFAHASGSSTTLTRYTSNS